MAAEDKDLNRDPLTDEPGAHPVGTGVGAAGGAVAGAAAGALGGPLGAAVGGMVGAVVGGLTGKAAAEAVNPTAEEAYWREQHSREPYYERGRSFDDYAPAYRLGLTGRTRYEDWDSAQPQLASEWETSRGGSSLSWQQAQPASRAAWNRIDSLASGASGTSAQGGMPGMDGTADSRIRGGAAAAVGEAQSAGNMSGDRDDVVDALNDLAECCKDGEYGFRACAEQAERSDLKSVFLQRADDCRGAAQELYEQIRQCGGKADEGGSFAGAMHRGWVSVKAALSTYDDKAVLEECERGEDNALARYRKALKQPLPAGVKLIVERQMQGVQRNHDQIKMLRDQFRAQS
ncbi:MAG TPA: PA2169 family four-helix-bundle protein [Ramlibacter sp.]|nr:PA2169 family four-helix-bundle protein [Ramlibacter sp.]